MTPEELRRFASACERQAEGHPQKEDVEWLAAEARERATDRELAWLGLDEAVSS